MPAQQIVLVVEDDDDVREAFAALLRASGYIVETAADGHEALTLLRQDSEGARVILLDLMMPGMDGVAFRAAQLGDPRIRDIPVVVVSADSEGRRQAERMKVAAYLRKPVEPDALLTIVDRYASR
jgi:CheY-like chemotaxis protein